MALPGYRDTSELNFHSDFSCATALVVMVPRVSNQNDPDTRCRADQSRSCIR